MNISVKHYLKMGLVAIMSWLTGKHVIFLPAEARDEESILDLRAPYRTEGPIVTVELREPGPAHLVAEILDYEGHFPTKRIWKSLPRSYPGPCNLKLNLSNGMISLAEQEWDCVEVPFSARRFCWRLTLVYPDGCRRTRMIGHYQMVERPSIEEPYFEGENYVDYEAQAASEYQKILELLKESKAHGPILEIGCATGGLLAALDAAGYTSTGLDVSKWAVDRANKRLGPDRVWVCDVENDPFPPMVSNFAPFGTIVLWSILEHFRDPFAALARLTHFSSKGTILLINTTNTDSMTHMFFDKQWEGYFDWTHYGIEYLSVHSLRKELPRLGWRINRLSTYLVWDNNADPTRATLRDWWISDARFRRLMSEREMGDLITCVAVKE